MRVQKKRVKSHIFKIENPASGWLGELREIQDSVVAFFSSLMQAKHCDMTRFTAFLIPSIVFESDNEILCAVPTLQEIKEAVFDIDKDSVAGPDGFSSYFYQQCWSIISADLHVAVVDFFHGADMPRGVTSTTLVFLPKTANASKWSDFRPISLCTVLNKIMTKVLATRLGKILPSIISENQSGFMGGHLISDNILLAQELIGRIDQRARGGNIAIKLDMMKAYDRMEWNFLYKML